MPPTAQRHLVGKKSSPHGGSLEGLQENGTEADLIVREAVFWQSVSDLGDCFWPAVSFWPEAGSRLEFSRRV